MARTEPGLRPARALGGLTPLAGTRAGVPSSALAAAIVLATSAFAYPIPPQTLWELTRDAEAIVVAHVDAVKELPRG